MNGNSDSIRAMVLSGLALPDAATDADLSRAIVTQSHNVSLTALPFLELGACVLSHRQPRPAAVTAARRVQLRCSANNFCDNFFEYSTSERKAEYERLISESERHPDLAERLTGLAPGLDIDSDDLEMINEPARPLARLILEIFPLSFPQQALRQLEELSNVNVRLSLSALNVRRIRNGHPVIAALNRTFLSNLDYFATEPTDRNLKIESADLRLRSAHVEPLPAEPRPAGEQALILIVSFVLCAFFGPLVLIITNKAFSTSSEPVVKKPHAAVSPHSETLSPAEQSSATIAISPEAQMTVNNHQVEDERLQLALDLVTKRVRAILDGAGIPDFGVIHTIAPDWMVGTQEVVFQRQLQSAVGAAVVIKTHSLAELKNAPVTVVNAVLPACLHLIRT
jgi:biopolymer transport protein ExbD